MQDKYQCVVIGAGISGLCAARALQEAGVKTTVVDKGRSVGGRLATRWIEMGEDEKGYFDHGAQFFTVREARFQTLVDEWITAGIVKEWSRGFADATGEANNDGHPRYCGRRGMNAIARFMAEGIEVKINTKVERLATQNRQWMIELEQARSLSTDAVILTPPVPQSLKLLEAGDFQLSEPDQSALKNINYDPCFAVMVVLQAPARLPEPGALQLRQEPIAWIADNHRKGISPDAFAVTIHAGPEFTREYWDADPETVARMLIHAAGEWLRSPILKWQVHRWRYSQPLLNHSESCLLANNEPPLIFAGDAFGAARVEGAAMSGLAAAEAVINLL